MNKIRKIKAAIINDKDSQALMSNFAYLTLLQIAGYVFPLLTMPYLAKVIGPDGFGKIAFAAAIMIWIKTVTDWGFNYTATREVAKNRDNHDFVSDIFSNVFWARCILMLISLIFLICIVCFVPKLRAEIDLILVTFLMIPGHIMFPDWFFQALERMKYITILNLISKLIFTILVFFFIKNEDDYILQPLFVSLGFLLSGVVAMFYIILKWKYRLKRPQLKNIKMIIKGSTDVFVNTLMPNLYNSFSVVLLGFFSGASSTGIYDAGKKTTTIAYNMISIFARVFFPYLSRNKNKHSFYAYLSLSVSIIIAIILFAFAPLIIEILFSNAFEQSIVILRITSLSLIFTTMSSVYGANYLLVNNYDRLLRNITVLSSFLGFLISFPLIILFKQNGAAFTYLISSFMMGVIPCYYVSKIRKKYDVK